MSFFIYILVDSHQGIFGFVKLLVLMNEINHLNKDKFNLQWIQYIKILLWTFRNSLYRLFH